MPEQTTPAEPAPRMLPELTPLNREFWTGGADGELRILRCQECRFWIHPPVDTCPSCGSKSIKAEATSGRGTVFTFTVNRHPYNPDVPLPILIAIVELDEQANLRFTTNIVGCEPDDLRIGMPVAVQFEQHGEIFVPVFAPA